MAQNQTVMENKIVLAIVAGVVLLFANYIVPAWADDSQVNGVQIKATDAIKKDPALMKILYNIELAKINYAAYQQKQSVLAQQQKIIEDQRNLANQYLQADLAGANNAKDMTNPQNAYNAFVGKVDSSAQGLFMDQFAYMQSKVSQAKSAKIAVLHSGGSREDAMSAYAGAAAMQKVELVSVNKSLNVKYRLADENIQNQFNQYGNLKKYQAS